jgi:hypothetical protein
MRKATFALLDFPFTRFSFAALVLCALIGAANQGAFALSCGENITADATLTADLGPCPANGLGVDGATVHVTLNLNGHRIIGQGSGSGVLVGAVPSGLTIKGPGGIFNFQTGVSLGGAAAHIVVSDARVEGNQTGININGSPGPIEIRKNTITGGSQSQNGINLGDAGSISIVENHVSGFTTGINILGETDSTLEGNIVTLNQTGIDEADPDLSCAEIRKNEVTLNVKDGIDEGYTGATPAALARHRNRPAAKALVCEIASNTVGWNGASGIMVAGGEYEARVHDNDVSHDGANGIGVIGSASEGPIKVTGNHVQHNATDLFWNSIGTSACWKNNTFGTSNPATLPPCP